MLSIGRRPWRNTINPIVNAAEAGACISERLSNHERNSSRPIPRASALVWHWLDPKSSIPPRKYVAANTAANSPNRSNDERRAMISKLRPVAAWPAAIPLPVESVPRIERFHESNDVRSLRTELTSLTPVRSRVAVVRGQKAGVELVQARRADFPGDTFSTVAEAHLQACTSIPTHARA